MNLRECRHVIVDYLGNILEVTNMYDRFGNDTHDPAIAENYVIVFADGNAVHVSTEDAPVYTVH